MLETSPTTTQYYYKLHFTEREKETFWKASS